METASVCQLSKPSLVGVDYVRVADSTGPLVAVKEGVSGAEEEYSGAVGDAMSVVVTCPHCECIPCVLRQGNLREYIKGLGNSMICNISKNGGDAGRKSSRIAEALKGVAHQKIYGAERVMLPDCVVDFIDATFPV